VVLGLIHRPITNEQIVHLLFEIGRHDEVHVRITAPPIMFPCFYYSIMAEQGGARSGEKDPL